MISKVDYSKISPYAASSCKNAGKYKGVRKPKCLNGAVCDRCRLKYNERQRFIQEGRVWTG